MNRTPKMPPRHDYIVADGHYRPERLILIVAQILVATVVAGVLLWAWRSYT